MFSISKLFWKIKVRSYKKKLKACGSNVTISFPFTFTKPHNISIGNHVYIGPDAWISAYGKVNVMNGTIIGPRLKVYTGNHNYESDKAIPYDGLTIIKSVTINENVWIGGDVILLPGITIGEGAVIGAGSVVVKDILPGHVVGGNPAKFIKARNMDLYFRLKSENKIYLDLKAKKKLDLYFEERY